MKTNCNEQNSGENHKGTEADSPKPRFGSHPLLGETCAAGKRIILFEFINRLFLYTIKGLLGDLI